VPCRFRRASRKFSSPNFTEFDRILKDTMGHYLDDVDWAEVHERLVLAACRLFSIAPLAGEDRVLESFGVGPEDLANDAICHLVDPENSAVRWDHAAHGLPTTRGVVKYLDAVIRNDFLDKVSAKRRKLQNPLYVGNGDDQVHLRIDPPDPTKSIEVELADRSVRQPLGERLQRDFAARPDDDLRRYVELQFDGDRFVPYKPRDAADLLGVPVENIYLLKEKLERRLLRLFRGELAATQSRRTKEKNL